METLDEINRAFEQSWEKHNGREQTSFFMRLAIDNLPTKILSDLSEAISIIDVGCAMGDGVNVLQEEFPTPRVNGLDPSSVAIAKAEQFYPHNTFACKTLEEMTKFKLFWTAAFCSNVLEHFEDPMPMFRQLFEIAHRYVVVLTPYNETELIPGHYVTIDQKTFPDILVASTGPWKKVFSKEIDVTTSKYWGGWQILQVWENQE